MTRLTTFAVVLSIAIPSYADQFDDANIRDVFFDAGDEPAEATVGRLGIAIVGDGAVESVGLGYPFRSGDKFRFDITSSQGGWLYILHTSPSGERRQLWPRPGSSPYRVEAGVQYFVPAHPANFRFANSTGDETFYVAIRPGTSPPQLNRMSAANSGQPYSAGGATKQKIVDFRLRDPFGDSDVRAALFDASESDDNDHYLYFSSIPDGEQSSAIVIFRLLHVPQ